MRTGAARSPLLAGVRVKVLDGTCLEGASIAAGARASTAGPPGKALAVFDPALDLITALYPARRVHAGAGVVGAVVAAVRAGELWIADAALHRRVPEWAGRARARR
ncbi:MAG: hypothetical protein H6976_15025 [Gammaproteobacteria bacterium]|nr:hypothetical protein [Gammaproteobacteria bacterium]